MLTSTKSDVPKGWKRVSDDYHRGYQEGRTRGISDAIDALINLLPPVDEDELFKDVPRKRDGTLDMDDAPGHR